MQLFGKHRSSVLPTPPCSPSVSVASEDSFAKYDKNLFKKEKTGPKSVVTRVFKADGKRPMGPALIGIEKEMRVGGYKVDFKTLSWPPWYGSVGGASSPPKSRRG